MRGSPFSGDQNLWTAEDQRRPALLSAPELSALGRLWLRIQFGTNNKIDSPYLQVLLFELDLQTAVTLQ